jgi:hypothetical protein
MQHATRVEYLYRDASNYKFRGSFDVLGTVALAELEGYLFDGYGFVPEKIGIDALRPRDENDDDHCIHTFESFEQVTVKDWAFTASELIDRLQAASRTGWFG